MTDDNKQNNNESQKPEGNNQNEEIPLWLQGLQDNEDEPTSPIEVEKSSDETSVSDVSEETQDEANTLSAEVDDEKETQTGSDTYPDWLTELSQIDPGKPLVSEQQDEETFPEQNQDPKDSLIQGDESEEVETEPFPWDKMPEEAEEEFKEQSTTEDDFMQSELAEVEITESIDKNISEEISQDEDLPPWLQEMISVPQEVSPDQLQPQDDPLESGDQENKDEPTEPLKLSGYPDTAEDPESVEDEIEMDELTDLEEESEQDDFEVDEWADLEEESEHDDFEVDEWADLEEESEQDDLDGDEWADMEEESKQAKLETEIDQESDKIPEYEDVDLEEIDYDFTPDQTPSEWVPEDIHVSNYDLEEQPSPIDDPDSFIEEDTQPINVSVEKPEEEVDQEVQSQDEEEQNIEGTFPDPFQQEHLDQENLPEKLQEAQELLSINEIEKEVDQDVQSQNEEEQNIEGTYPDSFQQEHQEQESLSENLQEAQELLSRNEIEDAVERIKVSDDRSTYSQEIQTWLVKASNAVDKPNFNFWELLGDVASENKDHDLAFDSYAKAIKSLLESKEENDEIG